jgi:HlyD family secretion protein
MHSFLKSSLIIFSVIILFTGCSNTTDYQDNEKTVKPVKVIEVKTEEKDIMLSYTGHIRAKEMKKLSFKTGGKISEVYISEGDNIKKGQNLISIDKSDIEYSVKAAKASQDAAWSLYKEALKGADASDVEIARINIEKARNAYETIEENHEKVKTLYQENAVSENDFNLSKLEYDIAKNELLQSEEALKRIIAGVSDEKLQALRAQYEQAGTNYDYQKSVLEDTVIVSDIDGVVVSVLAKEGEITGAGYPVIIVRSTESIMVTGITQNEISSISKGIKVEMLVNNKKIEGEIIRIDETPDEKSRTYNIDISIDGNNFRIGTIGKVKIPVDKIRGLWIPVTAIMTNGIDFVYTADDGKVKKKIIKVIDYIESDVQVEGLDSGDLLIVEGIGQIKENDLISIIND